ncbi:SRPBCC family protein [Gandjariella thermophila]|uniref:Cyclase n=1 Tax=Gandjariella thermophila TaxID=1931992 RepID=A0A4D4J7M6_9PSEU|nr:SRPBCC family protein [Gandjariella thermophila]GDY30668.1 hypothetical protein GTS_23010 [Gandjariella thermophila]
MDSAGLRYTDGPTVEVDVLIDAPTEAVWELVTDMSLPSRFSGEFQGAEWLDGATGPAVGARFVGTNEHPAIGTWQTTSTIVEYQPGRCLEYAVQDPAQPAARWRITLEPEGDRTRLRQWMRIGPGPSPLRSAIEAAPEKEARILDRRMSELRRNMTATVRGIKELAEAARGGPA